VRRDAGHLAGASGDLRCPHAAVERECVHEEQGIVAAAAGILHGEFDVAAGDAPDGSGFGVVHVSQFAVVMGQGEGVVAAGRPRLVRRYSKCRATPVSGGALAILWTPSKAPSPPSPTLRLLESTLLFQRRARGSALVGEAWLRLQAGPVKQSSRGGAEAAENCTRLEFHAPGFSPRLPRLRVRQSFSTFRA